MIDDDEAFASAIAATLDEMDAFLGSCSAGQQLTVGAHRAHRTAIERQSRRRRQQRLKSLRAEVRGLEQRLARVIIRFGANGDPSSKSSDKLVITTAPVDLVAGWRARIQVLRQRIHEFVLRTWRLEDEATMLRERLRQGHHGIARIQRLLERPPQPEDPFDLSAAAFEPLSMEEALVIVRDSLRSSAHLDTHEHESSGMELHGWRDRHCIRGDALCIDVTKRFLDRDAEQLMLETWGILSSTERLRHVLTGPGQTTRGRVLQSLTEDIRILHLHTVEHESSRSGHVVLLLYRAQVDGVFVVGYRDIPVPGFQCLLRDGDEWTAISKWTRFTPARDGDGRVIGAVVTDGGELERREVASISQMLRVCLQSVVFWEQLCAQSTLLAIT